jgi:cell division protein FtsZ
MTDFRFDVPIHHKSIIKVIGVGGGGSNAVGYMYTQGIQDVDFVVCNTDHQALETNPVKEKLQIGSHLTEGLGAGARPEVGNSAAKESKEEIRKLLSKDTKMLFITAGMGGGTGTGAAPVIAEIAKELGILTVGIVTMPFSFEGRRKKKYAEEGVENLKKHCDTVLVILNERLKEIYGDLDIDEAFSKADDILTNAARSIAQIITHKAKMNVDFEDVRTVMKSSGQTVMGSAVASGADRAQTAVENALSSPLLNSRDVKGAQRILLSITYSEDAVLKINELSTITEYVDDMIGAESDEVIWGHGIDNTLESGEVRVTIIATGFLEDGDVPAPSAPEVKNEVVVVEAEQEVEEEIQAQATEQVERKVVNLDSTQNEVIHHRPDTADDYKNSISFEISPESRNIIKINLEDGAPIVEDVLAKQKLNSNAHEIRINEIRDRIKRMAEVTRLRGDQAGDGSYKAYFDEPAFARRNKQISSSPNSNDSNLSRYSLNDDDEIVGNNRFFDDNVD